MPSRRSAHELRCFCARKPLLALYGITDKGEPYVHVRVFKQARIFGEVLVTGGRVRLHCRECLRWHEVVIQPKRRAELVEASVPAYVETEPSPARPLRPVRPNL